MLGVFKSQPPFVHPPPLMQDVFDRWTEKRQEMRQSLQKRLLMKMSKRDRVWENSHATPIVSGWGGDALRQKGCKHMAAHHAQRYL